MNRAPTGRRTLFTICYAPGPIMWDRQRQRRSVRLKGRDYSWPDTYFVTICTAERKCLLGHIENGQMCENILGRLVRREWQQLAIHFPDSELDAFVTMPNHVHGLLHLRRRVAPYEEPYKVAKFAQPQCASVGWMVRTFKAGVTHEARRMLRRPGFSIWQRNYFERVVRDAREYADAYRYICDNPKNWEKDDENRSAKAAGRTL
jgi:putative transposase